MSHLVVLMLWVMASSLLQAQARAQSSIPMDVENLIEEVGGIKEEVRGIKDDLRTLKDSGIGSIGGEGLSLGTTTEGRGQIVVKNRSGRNVVLALARSGLNSGYLGIADRSGNQQVILTVDEKGNGVVEVKGRVLVNGKKVRVHDYAEILDLATRDGIRAGSVVAWDPDASGLVPASASNARRVVGVISGAGKFRPGMVIGSRTDGSKDFPVAVSGVIYARVSGEAGPVEPGDLLVPSSAAGVGMRAADPRATAGTVFGKALEPWSGAGEGLVLMLVMNR